MLENFSKQEINAILAGLRLLGLWLRSELTLHTEWRAEIWISLIYRDGVADDALQPDDVQALCERINTNTILCPYCQHKMAWQGHHDNWFTDEDHTANWVCPHCGAGVVNVKHPPREGE
jgi:hypothetical protein